MQVARYWRMKKQSYRLQGVVVNNIYSMVPRQVRTQTVGAATDEEKLNMTSEKPVHVA